MFPWCAGGDVKNHVMWWCEMQRCHIMTSGEMQCDVVTNVEMRCLPRKMIQP